MAEVKWQARRITDGVLVDVTADISGTTISPAPVPNALEAGSGGGGVTVDNQSDPPTEVTSIIARGATLSGDEADLGVSLRVTEAALTNAQIKALGAGTVVNIVAAPGAGKVVVPFLAFLTIDATAAAYTGVNAGATINLKYNGGGSASAPLLESATQVSVALGADDEVTWATFGPRSGANGEAAVYDASEGENLPLGLAGWNGGDGAFTGGNAANAGRVKVFYTIEDLA